MFRSPRHAALALLLVAVALLPGAAIAQEPTSTEVLDLTLPVLDLELATSSLDGAFQRTDTRKSVRVTLSADVLFEFNRSRLTAVAGSRLKEVTGEIRRAGPGTVTIAGHTDSKGTSTYNAGLSRRRAESVRTALARTLGAGAPVLVATGKGESDPVARNLSRDGSDNPRGRARNRRVEIRIPKD